MTDIPAVEGPCYQRGLEQGRDHPTQTKSKLSTPSYNTKLSDIPLLINTSSSRNSSTYTVLFLIEAKGSAGTVYARLWFPFTRPKTETKEKVRGKEKSGFSCHLLCVLFIYCLIIDALVTLLKGE